MLRVLSAHVISDWMWLSKAKTRRLLSASALEICTFFEFWNSEFRFTDAFMFAWKLASMLPPICRSEFRLFDELL